MGINKRLKRRHRRQQKAKVPIRHKLMAGRTGQVRYKQRAGMLHEFRRVK